MNPLWDPAGIPSGKSVTDMIRAIRRHLYKIHQYGLEIDAYRRKDEYKNNVWDTEEKRLEYVRDQVDVLDQDFRSTSYVNGFLAFLVCSHPIDFITQRRKSLPFLVPPLTVEEEAEFGGIDDDVADLAPKPPTRSTNNVVNPVPAKTTRRANRAVASRITISTNAMMTEMRGTCAPLKMGNIHRTNTAR